MRRTILGAILAGLMGIQPASAGLLDPSSFASDGTLNLTSGSYTINTTGNGSITDSMGNVLYTGTTFNQGGFNPTVTVLDFNSISIAAGVTMTVTGTNPLALLSKGGATIGGVINANGLNGQLGTANPGGSNGAGGAGGPGGSSGGSGGGPGQMGNGPGGGAGGIGGLAIDSFGVGGGYGGLGGNPGNRIIFGATYGNLAQSLQGGSGGGGSGSNLFSAGAAGVGAGAPSSSGRWERST